jgi:hypothetical protein
MKLSSHKTQPFKPTRSLNLHLDLTPSLISSTFEKKPQSLLTPSLISSTFEKKPQSLLTPSTKTQDSQRSVSHRRKILTFQDFLLTCEDLQKDLTGLSQNIEKSLTSKLKKKKILLKPVTEIRNKEYFEGVKRIEERVKAKKNSQSKEDLGTLRSLMAPGAHDQFITEADVISKQGLDFLAENRRSFGKMIREIEKEPEELIGDKEKKKKKKKLIELLKETSSGMGKKRKSMPCLVKGMDLDDGEKKKLPVLDLARMIASKARNDANRFFVDRKLINNRVQVKRRSIFNLNYCK